MTFSTHYCLCDSLVDSLNISISICTQCISITCKCQPVCVALKQFLLVSRRCFFSVVYFQRTGTEQLVVWLAYEMNDPASLRDDDGTIGDRQLRCHVT